MVYGSKLLNKNVYQMSVYKIVIAIKKKKKKMNEIVLCKISKNVYFSTP